MRKVELGTFKKDIPDCWRECTPQQIEDLLPFQLTPIDQLEPYKAAILKWSIVEYLLVAPEALLSKLTTTDRWRLMKLGGWVWKEQIQQKPFPSFDFEGVTYILPDDGFVNTSAIEVAMSNIQYIAYGRKKNPDLSAVFSLVATLCRPARPDLEIFKASNDWDNDVRERYNTARADERAKLFKEKSLPIGIVMAVLQYFERSNNTFLDAYKTVYDQSDSDEKPLYANGEGVVTTLMDIAKTSAFGDFDKVCGQNAHTIWLFLRDQNLKIHKANEQAERDADD